MRGRGVLTGPSDVNLDFGLYREFPLPFRESMKIQFRAEAFNIFNHPNFSNPGSQYESTTFGVITSAADPRILQFALKFLF